MTFLEKFFANTRLTLTKSRLHSLYPIVEAAEGFFLSSSETTTSAPHVRDPLDCKRFMFLVILALCPVLLASIYFFGLRILAMMAVSYVAGGLVETAFAVIRKKQIHEGFLVTGFIFPLVLPPTTPLWMVAVGVIFGVLVGKELFGGTGRNLFNPVLFGRCFLAIAYPRELASGYVIAGEGWSGRFGQYITWEHVDALSGATPLALARQGQLYSISQLFFGSVSGSAGETSAALILLGGVFLCFTRVINFRTVCAILGSAYLLSTLLNLVDPSRFSPPLFHLLSGGLMLGAFFMATDPVTSPIGNAGKWIYGILIGLLTITIRCFSGYVEGVMFAILLANMCSPLIDEFFVQLRIRRLRHEI